MRYNITMMKRLFLTLIITAFISTLNGAAMPAQARLFDSTRTAIEQAREINATFKAIKDVIKIQNVYCNKRDYDSLFALYKDDFINNDGFTKDVYFKLIKDTWKSYPDISYTTEIKSINITNNYAAVEAYEYAVATTTENIDELEIVGELHGFAHTVYYLEKVGKNWKIASENILEEKTSLSYGDARYLNINLNAPELVGAGKSYSTNLTINVPDDSVVVASIGQEKITYPQSRSEEVFRRLNDDNTLERMFTANSDNTNEYNIASVGITRAEIPDMNNPQDIRVYMSGIAFVMTRVNVVPANKFIKLDEDKSEDKNGQKDK